MPNNVPIDTQGIGQGVANELREEIVKGFKSAGMHWVVAKHWQEALKAHMTKAANHLGRWYYSADLIDWKTRNEAAKELGHLMNLYPPKELNVHGDLITDRTRKFMEEVDGNTRDKLPSELALLDEESEKEEGEMST